MLWDNNHRGEGKGFGELAADAQVRPSDIVSGEWEFVGGVARHRHRKSGNSYVVDISEDIH